MSSVKDVLKSGKALINFRADWCNPCKEMDNIIQEMYDDGMNVCVINIDDEPEHATFYNVKGIPSFIVVEDGIVLDQTMGLKSKEELVKLFNYV